MSCTVKWSAPVHTHTHTHTHTQSKRETTYKRSELNGTPICVFKLTPESVKMCTYLGEKKMVCLCRYNYIKNLEMWSPWIIQLCHKPNNKCHKRKTEIPDREEKPREDRGKTWVMQPQAKECQEPREAARCRKEFPQSFWRELVPWF